MSAPIVFLADLCYISQPLYCFTVNKKPTRSIVAWTWKRSLLFSYDLCSLATLVTIHEDFRKSLTSTCPPPAKRIRGGPGTSAEDDEQVRDAIILDPSLREAVNKTAVNAAAGAAADVARETIHAILPETTSAAARAAIISNPNANTKLPDIWTDYMRLVPN